MNALFRLTAVLTCLCASTAAFALFVKPPDTRSWDQVTADFVARKARNAWDGDYDGRRLKELDPKRAVTFLIPFLAKDRPAGLRMKAIGALGCSSFPEAVPALAAIAKDETESVKIRAQSLTPGLCDMKSPEAVATAISLSTHKSDLIRSSAYWVLSSHGTDDAIEALASRLRANDKPLYGDLIYALNSSENPRAGKIVFDLVDFSALQHDKNLVQAYARAMERYRVAEAQEQMLAIAQQPAHAHSAEYALRYFASFPREELVPLLIARIEALPGVEFSLYESVTQFIKSPAISAESKEKLSVYIANGKVKKPPKLLFTR